MKYIIELYDERLTPIGYIHSKLCTVSSSEERALVFEAENVEEMFYDAGKVRKFLYDHIIEGRTIHTGDYIMEPVIYAVQQAIKNIYWDRFNADSVIKFGLKELPCDS